jgi:far upstream element-binding protein
MSGMSGMTGMSGMSGMMGGEEVAELMIPANKVGLIIGKGGEMIKALQEKAGCKMQMIQDGPYSNAPEKPLRMSGAPDNCKKARELVLQLMEQKELEFGSQARGLLGSETSMAGSVVGVPHTIEIQVLKQMVGYVIGRGGEHINNIQSNCGVRLQFQNDVPGTDYRIATISGTPEGCQRARKWVDDLVAEQRQNQGFRPRLELPNPTGPGVQTIQFGVPGNKCGLIIGKGGDTIRQIQVQSGAHVELHRGTQPNPDEKLFNVRGNSQQIQLAQQLIRQKYENVPGAGGSPQYGPGSPYQGAQVFGAPQGAMYGGPGGAPAAAPWAGQYPSQGQQQTDPNHQAAWAAYYQQLYAAQAAQAQAAQAQQQGAQPPAGGQQPQPQQQMAGGGATPSQEQIQSQWAEYYRQMGYYYQQAGQPGQQQGQQPPHAAPGGPENKVCV